MIVIGSRYEHDCLWRYINVPISTIEELEHQLKEYALLKKPIYVCWMFTNNLTGDIFDVVNIGELCHKYEAYYICDMTATIGHNSIFPNLDKWCDCCFASAHKWYGEKGNGFMWVSERFAKHLKLTKNNRDEYGIRWGTTNVAGAIAMTEALKQYCIKNNESHYYRLTNMLYNQLQYNNIEAHNICLNEKTRSHAINAIYLPNINADALQTYLASKDIYIGVAHSACAGTEDYRVLEAMGFNKKIASQTIRVSFGADNSYDDIKGLVNEIKKFKELF